MVSTFYDTPAKQFRWNWGAFMYNWVFGFANRAWLTFLCLIPGFNIIWMFVCGAMGEKWVWNAGHFEDGYTFRAVMDSWNRGGKIAFIVCMVVLVLGILALILCAFFFEDAYVQFKLLPR